MMKQVFGSCISFLLITTSTVFAQSDSTAADTVVVVKAGDSSQLAIMLAVLALVILILFLLKTALKPGPEPMR